MNIHIAEPQSYRWEDFPETIHPGEKGQVAIREILEGDIRLRLAQYSPGYEADHWCVKGHVVHVLEGQVFLEHLDGESMVLQAGMIYMVGDDRQPHMVRTLRAARLFILD
ncbi:MAG: DHCW motif cupin fold protein [Lewinellaceae bacterium]|nr:DHCW motif cupin fold protein [Saprospiraceae bacterium]MCB9312421.1 DHCW motif cupin fold protein [Lewinellaceae bacterium]HRW74855.1 DHCW motif cupin fold protein [Saprospiraceae bacterium]